MLLSLFCAYTIHLLEDMPTPASTWGGVRFFWPFQVYIGGSGHIWWWNNYDIFLTVFTVLILNLALLSYFHFHRFKIKKYVSSLFLIGASFILFQTFTRRYDFAYTGNCQNYLEMESESKSIQKEILGDDLYMMMNETDRYLKVAF